MKNIKPFEKYGMNEGDNQDNYMFWQNLNTMKHAIDEILAMDKDDVNRILASGHEWATDHLSTSADDMEEVYHFLSGAKGAPEQTDTENTEE